MMKANRLLVAAGIAGMVFQGAGSVTAQDAGGGGFGGGFGGGNSFDPAQLQQQYQQTVMNNYRTLLEVKNEIEWTAIKDRLQKVLDFRQESGLGSLSSLVGMFTGGLGGGGNAGMGTGGAARRGLANMVALSPEEQALQKAIDEKAPIADLKAAQTKVIEARKARQAKQDKAQEELRKVLSARQEAIALLNGLI
jgi:hypothetical protein